MQKGRELPFYTLEPILKGNKYSKENKRFFFSMNRAYEFVSLTSLLPKLPKIQNVEALWNTQDTKENKWRGKYKSQTENNKEDSTISLYEHSMGLMFEKTLDNRI